jgi:cysteinyl-tRNA synthetase
LSSIPSSDGFSGTAVIAAKGSCRLPNRSNGFDRPQVASLAVLHVFDTAAGRIVPFEPATSGRVSIYSCGPTVYGAPHIGHGRFATAWDVLRRYLEWQGLEVTFASNITDVDDKIINRANREGRSWSDVAEQYEGEWYEGMDAIGVRRPDHAPRASEYIEQMVDLIAALVERGAAYETSDGVYMSVDQVPGYGVLAPGPVDALLAGARVDVVEEKRSPRDFALWKKAKPGEPTWDSPWGPGRPGWHTECVAMSLDLLGDGFDIHTGGMDLRFPHHENERAQAVALGKVFCRHWMHNGFVEVGGEKMSKSLDNFTDLVDLVESGDARAYRLLLLQSHYRAPIEVSRSTLAQAAGALGRLDSFVQRVAEAGLDGAGDPDVATLDRFRERMDADLDTPGAMAVVFDAVRRANAALDSGDREVAGALTAAVRDMAGALGLRLAGGGDAAVDPRASALALRRDEARAARDYAAADSLRDQLTELGYEVMDTAEGTRLRRRGA